jgi:hypothetical protein
MNKEVSIVLSVERKNYRKLAQEWFGLTDEQMVDVDVHHNPARHQGGRNIPEHLFVYHKTLHSAVHGNDFVLWARNTGVSEQQAAEWGKIGGRIGGKRRSKETCSTSGKRMCVVIHERKDKDEKSIHAKKVGKITSSQLWEDPDHPELGTHNAGNLVRIQKSKSLPHGKENRRRIQ